METLWPHRRWSRRSNYSTLGPFSGIGLQGQREGSEGHFTFRRTIHTRDTGRSSTGGRVGRTIASTAFNLGAHRPLWVFGGFCYYLLLYLLYLMHELST